MNKKDNIKIKKEEKGQRFKLLKEKIAINQKIIDYVEDLEKEVKITTKHDKEKIMSLKYDLEKKLEDVKNLNKSLIILYFLLYFSFVSYTIPDMFFLSDLKNAISKIVSLFGTTIIIVLITLINTSKRLIYTDVKLITTRLIAIFTKYEK